MTGQPITAVTPRRVGEFAMNESELLAVVIHIINSGQVRLCGRLAGASIEPFGGVNRLHISKACQLEDPQGHMSGHLLKLVR